ncbi:MAG: hypothetical protein R6U63_16150 [Longimicrobiales bacterium]
MGFFMFVAILVFGILALAGGFQWLSDRRREPLPRADTDRIDQLESALASLESRLDELQDQQRFLERLLADRPERRSLGAGDEGSDPGSPDAGSVLFDTDEGEEAGDR